MVKYLKVGEDFSGKHFDAGFGFSKSSMDSVKPKNHSMDPDHDDEYGDNDGSYVSKMRKGGGVKAKAPVKKAMGGMIDGAPGPAPAGAAPMGQMPSGAPGPSGGAGALSRAMLTMPLGDAAKAAQGMVQAGRAIGVKQAAGAIAAGAARGRMMQRPPMAPQAPAMAKGGKVMRKAAGGGVSKSAAYEGDWTDQLGRDRPLRERADGRMQRNPPDNSDDNDQANTGSMYQGSDRDYERGPNSLGYVEPTKTYEMAKGGHMTAKMRNALPTKDFAGPDRSYPISDKNHARNALARVSQFGDSKLQAKVRAKVHSKFPSIGEK